MNRIRENLEAASLFKEKQTRRLRVIEKAYRTTNEKLGDGIAKSIAEAVLALKPRHKLIAFDIITQRAREDRCRILSMGVRDLAQTLKSNMTLVDYKSYHIYRYLSSFCGDDHLALSNDLLHTIRTVRHNSRQSRDTLLLSREQRIARVYAKYGAMFFTGYGDTSKIVLPESRGWFGVEIECYIDDAGDSNRGRYAEHPGVILLAKELHKRGLHTFAEITTDGSLNGGTDGKMAIEVRVITDASFENLRKTCEALKECGAVIDRACGLHIHIDQRGVGEEEYALRAANLVSWYRMYRAMVPKSRYGNQYCRYPLSIRHAGRQSRKTWLVERASKGLSVVKTSLFHLILDDLKYREVAAHNSSSALCREYGRKAVPVNPRTVQNRYAVVNMCRYTTSPKKDTIEVRIHSGTVDFEKIKNWILILSRAQEVQCRRLPVDKVQAVQHFSRKLNLDSSVTAYVFRRVKKFSSTSMEIPENIDSTVNEIEEDEQISRAAIAANF